MLDQQTLKLNLSYILHEPSDSRPVERAARDSNRFSRRHNRLLRTFASLNSTELAGRIELLPELESAIIEGKSGPKILSVSVGLPDLLPAIVQSLQQRKSAPELYLADDPGQRTSLRPVSFFGAQAALCMPPMSETETSLLVLGLIVPPGEQRLMLTGTHFSSRSGETMDMVEHDVLRELERIARDFVDQWIPRRALWSAPAEVEFPEIRGRPSSFGRT